MSCKLFAARFTVIKQLARDANGASEIVIVFKDCQEGISDACHFKLVFDLTIIVTASFSDHMQ